MNTQKTFHASLKEKLDHFVHTIYRISTKFPKSEVFGATSQLRRASLSVVLNYIEGFARQGDKTNRHFLEISYGSLKETEYLIGFCFEEGWFGKEDYESLSKLEDEIGAMLWSTMQYKKQLS